MDIFWFVCTKIIIHNPWTFLIFIYILYSNLPVHEYYQNFPLQHMLELQDQPGKYESVIQCEDGYVIADCGDNADLSGISYGGPTPIIPVYVDALPTFINNLSLARVELQHLVPTPAG